MSHASAGQGSSAWFVWMVRLRGMVCRVSSRRYDGTEGGREREMRGWVDDERAVLVPAQKGEIDDHW